MAEETLDIAPEIVDIAEETKEEIVEETLEPINEDEELKSPEKSDTIEQFLPEAKKKPGRPAGSRNKGPSKPRVKKVVSEPVVAPSRAPSPPRWDAQHQPIPTQATTEMAELMLRLLSNQSMERQRRKDAQRRAWFS